MSDMRVLKVAGFVALVFIGRAYLGSTLSENPKVYTLSESCAWRPKPWARYMGVNDRPAPNQATNTAEWACYRARGQKSHSPFINTILPSWPSASQRRAWDRSNEDRDSLHAQRRPASLIR